MNFKDIFICFAAIMLVCSTVSIADENSDSAEDRGNLNFDLSGLAMVRLVGVDEDVSPFNRYTTLPTKNKEMIFEVPQLSFGMDINWKDEVHFVTQVNYNPRLEEDYNNVHYDGEDNKIGLISAYFGFDDLFGPVDGRIGRFGLNQFSVENVHVLQTTKYTVFPSAGSALMNNIIFYGAQASYGMEEDSDVLFAWVAGLNAGMKKFHLPFYAPFNKQYFPHTDIVTDPVKDNYRIDSDVGMHFFGEVRDATQKYRIGGFYYTNGVKRSGNEGYETRLTSGSAGAYFDRFTLLTQVVNGETLFHETVTVGNTTFVEAPKHKFQSWFFLANFKIVDKHSVTVRYEVTEVQYDPGTFLNEIGQDVFAPHGRTQDDAYTICYNWDISDHFHLDVEYMKLDNDSWWFDNEVNDDIGQINFKMFF